MNNKKMTIIRIVIFYILAILPMIIGTTLLSNMLGEPLYSDKAEAPFVATAWGIIGMCSPTIANILTRIITREGMKESYLKLDMKKGKWKYYLLSVVIPLLYMMIAAVLILLVLCGDAEQLFTREEVPLKIWAYIGQIGAIFYFFLPFFGEEFGWRAYLTPKLEKLLPMPAVHLVSGILWGLWHAPVTVCGHNFGLDYKGFPYLGILLMCLMCTIMSPILTFLTKRTGSVIPAAIMHGVNNQASFGILLSLFASDEAFELFSETGNETFLLMLIPMALIAVVCFVLLWRDERKQKA